VAEESDAHTPAPGWRVEPIEEEEVDGDMARRLAINGSGFEKQMNVSRISLRHWKQMRLSVPFVYECGRTGLPREGQDPHYVYECARRDSRYFLCKPGHEIVGSGIGRIAEETGTFVIMEKLGVAGAIVAERNRETHADLRHSTD
jgi:hypothetical protein